MSRSSSRVLKKPQKVRECEPSPKKSTKKAQSLYESPANDKVYTYDTIAVCTCTVDLMVLVHFCNYSDRYDEWRPATELPDPYHRHSSEVHCNSNTAPLCPARLKGLKIRGPPIVSEPADDPDPSGNLFADCPRAMQYLSTTFASPNSKLKRPKPPVPLFPSSYPPSPLSSHPLPPPNPPPSPSPPALSSPAFDDREDVIFADPGLSMAIADSMWQPPPLPKNSIITFLTWMSSLKPSLIVLIWLYHIRLA